MIPAKCNKVKRSEMRHTTVVPFYDEKQAAEGVQDTLSVSHLEGAKLDLPDYK